MVSLHYQVPFGFSLHKSELLSLSYEGYQTSYVNETVSRLRPGEKFTQKIDKFVPWKGKIRPNWSLIDPPIAGFNQNIQNQTLEIQIYLRSHPF